MTFQWNVPMEARQGHLEIFGRWQIEEAFQPVTPSLRRPPRSAASPVTWPSIMTGHAGWNTVLNRSLADLVMLSTDFGQGPVPVAGLPWFATFFGRDSVLTSLQCLELMPQIAQNTVATLIQWQGQEENEENEEMPGKMVHEVRWGEMAQAGEVPFARYYGSVDVTPLFITLLGETYRRTGSHALLDRSLTPAYKALAWLQGDNMGTLGTPLYTFVPKLGRGLQVQSWKDSGDSMVFRDGSQAVAPLAVAEVQGYVYQALQALAHLPNCPDQRVLLSTAQQLQHTFHEHFWLDSRHYYAMALDHDLKPLDVLSSDIGQCLWTGIVSPEHTSRVVATLMDPQLFSGWGIRTLSSEELAYDPFSYHRGSVWPHDTSLVVAGLAKAGAYREAVQLSSALMDAAQQFPYARLPELFSGESRQDGIRPVPYPYACAPQAWASGAPLLIFSTLLGLHIDAPAHRIVIRPIVPNHVGFLSIKNLSLPDGIATIWTDGIDVQYTVPPGWTVEVASKARISSAALSS
jgi:glycogen debranching enzyme